ncbi:uncharacterized protein LOC131613257 [Vicia villosa]|uniref:uncharacterized protein LOC131613257 n=1 Tax=Vicia villosa TaxID=3911 RepID=UPI00273C1DEB|nr:uncharacterized protein LOC131613257 [Vicia villosa]
MLMAVAQDGNSNIFPVAFAIGQRETAASWSFFLRNLREYVAPQPDLCLISDRHASIESAYKNPTNRWLHPPSTHVYCIRHIAQNFMQEIKDRHLRKTLVNAGYVLTQPTFQHYRSEIILSNPNVGSWIDNLSREKWTRAYDNGVRWGHMTTNLVESTNGVFKGIRNLPITALVEKTYFRIASLFSTREQSAKANSHHVTAFDRFNRTFSVRETIEHNEGFPRQQYQVLLNDHWCDCGKFEAFRMPCSHVIAACAFSHRDALSLLSPIYKAETLLQVYRVAFPVVAKKDFWPKYDGEDIKLFPRKKHPPEVLFLSSALPAQSASQYPVNADLDP